MTICHHGPKIRTVSKKVKNYKDKPKRKQFDAFLPTSTHKLYVIPPSTFIITIK